MNVLLCGHRSFAARGLVSLLTAAGHTVTTFNRGPLGRAGNDVTGPVRELAENPHLAGSFDTVINYILLKDEPIANNVAFIDALLRFCREHSVKHLVHISSISSYSAAVSDIREDSPLERVPERKGAYGSLKAATDLRLLEAAPPDLKISMLRPGFILGPGVANPIVGNAARLPWNRLLVIGRADRILPVITRERVNEAVVNVTANPPADNRESLLLVARNSPTIGEFLQTCCTELGAGLGITRYPALVWRGVAIGAEAFARIIGQGKLQPYQKLASRLQQVRFDSARTEQRLGTRLDFDWRAELRQSLDGQETNVRPPYRRLTLALTPARSVAFLGFGRIVKQKHLPALKRLGFAGQVAAYDLQARTDETGQSVAAIDSTPLAPADLYVVASPGPAHVEAIPHLRKVAGTVLVEKPLCYSPDQLRQWAEFAAARPDPVIVCHNYRFKRNVERMMGILSRYHPGKLNHVSVHFQSPPVANDSAAWLRNERRARTLLMDYALHFIDLACMFSPGPWKTDGIRHELDASGHTRLIEGRATCPEYSVAMLLRQGFAPRRARLLFDFQNYSCSLGFFPDTFAVYMANDNPSLHKEEARQSRWATFEKISDKLRNRDSDPSHAHVFYAATAGVREEFEPIEVGRLLGFYELMFEIGRCVYEPEGGRA